MGASIAAAAGKFTPSMFEGLPSWFWKLVSIFRRKGEVQPAVSRAAHQTPYGEFIDEFGRVEFLPPGHGC
jgi:hypothetical protein